MRKDITHIKGIGFDDGTDIIVKGIMKSENVSYAQAVRMLIRIAHDKLQTNPRIIKGYTDAAYFQRKMWEEWQN